MTRRRVIWIAVAVAVVGAITWALLPPSEAPLYDYIAERRAAGLPTTRDEVRGPQPLEAENGAEDLRAAWAALVAELGPESSWKGSAFDTTLKLGEFGWPEGLSPEQRAELAKTAERLQTGIEPLVRALEKPRLVFPVRFNRDGWHEGDQDFELFSSADRALQIQAAGDADPGRRLAACRAVLRLAERVECGTSFDWVVAQSFRAGGIATLRHEVETGGIDAVAARAACDASLGTSVFTRFRAAERAESVELLENYLALVEGRAVTQTAKLTPWKRIEHRLEMARRRAAGTAGPLDVDFEAGNADLVVAVCRFRDAVAGVSDLRTLTTEDGVASVDPSGLIRAAGSKSMIGSFARTAVRTEAALRLARVALAVAEHRARSGNFPASLDELKPMFADGVPLDPFTDSPFIYERTATGVRIASQGRLADETPLDEEALREKCLVWEFKR